MATRYVSQTATNGYIIGVDTNDGLTKGAAKLTLESALSASTAGDTVIINDGLYTPTTLYTVANGVTIQPENAMAVELRGVAGQAAVTNITHSGSGTTTIGPIYVNANGALASIQRAGVSTPVTLNLVGTEAAMGTTAAIVDLCRRGLTHIEDVKISGTGGQYGYQGSASFGDLADKTLEIDGLAFDVSSSGLAYYGVSASRYSAGAPVGDVNVSIKNVTGEIQCDGIVVGVIVTGVDDPLIEDCDFAVESPSTTVSSIGIQVRATSANAPSPNGVIRNNRVDFNSPSGYAIIIGSNVDVDYSGGSVAYGNEATGRYFETATPHGIGLGRVTGGKLYNNISKDFYVGFIASINQGGLIFNNITDGIYGVDLYSKGCGATTRPIFANNTLIKRNRVGDMRAELATIAVNAQTDGTANTDTLFVNNRIVGVDMTPRMVLIAADQNATFERTGYPKTSALAADSFNWQGTTTAAAAWAAAHESDMVHEFDRVATTTDGKMSDFSRLAHVGKAVTGVTDSGLTDPWGNEFPANPNIGADQGAAANYGPWSTCDAPLPLSAQPCKSHALPIGTSKLTVFPGVASAAQIEEAK